MLGAPSAVLLVVLLVLPLLTIARESFEPFYAGRIGSTGGGLTLANYAQLLSPTYLLYFYDTFRIGLIASILSVLIAYPVAYMIATQTRPLRRKIYLTLFVTLMFLSVLARVYSIALTFSPIGFLHPLAGWLGVSPNSYTIAQVLVVLGLMHLIIPIATLTLIGALQNINPRLLEAAQSLGCPKWRAHLSVTLPLSAPSAVSAFVIGYALCVSAFVIPMILGKGRVLFVSNLVFNRFSEIANFPGGSAIAIVLLMAMLVLVWGISAGLHRLANAGGR